MSAQSISSNSINGDADGAPIPAFISKMTDWLQSQENTKRIEELKRESTVSQLKIRKKEVAILNELQEAMRPKIREIPGFWPFAMVRNRSFAKVCNTKEDLDAIGYLTDLELKIDAADPRAYDIIFTFAENPFFSDTTLIKSFVLEGGKTASAQIEVGNSSTAREEIDDAQLSFLESDLVPLKTEISWKSDETNLCLQQPRILEDNPEDELDFSGDTGSFFWFFAEEVDFNNLGSIFMNDLIPHSVDYFLGLGEDCDSDSDEDSEDDEEDEEDGEGDEEIDLEVDEDAPPKKRARRS